jgi:hypothetical protein
MLIELKELKIEVSFLAYINAPLGKSSRQQTAYTSSKSLVVLGLDTWQLSSVFLFRKPMDSTVVPLSV